MDSLDTKPTFEKKINKSVCNNLYNPQGGRFSRFEILLQSCRMAVINALCSSVRIHGLGVHSSPMWSQLDFFPTASGMCLWLGQSAFQYSLIAWWILMIIEYLQEIYRRSTFISEFWLRPEALRDLLRVRRESWQVVLQQLSLASCQVDVLLSEGRSVKVPSGSLYSLWISPRFRSGHQTFAWMWHWQFKYVQVVGGCEGDYVGGN